MVWTILEFALGLFISGITIGDVFASILIPGPTSSPLRVVSRVRQLSLPAWRFLSRRSSGGKRLSNSFAPLLFAFAFVGWLLLLCLGFGLMLHACAGSFTPPLHNFGQALYVAGAFLLTVGTNEVQPHGFVRVLVLIGALSGFGVITATITFIIEIQSNLHERETGVLKLNGLTGKPPSGVGLLETIASLRMQAGPGQLLQGMGGVVRCRDEQPCVVSRSDLLPFRGRGERLGDVASGGARCRNPRDGLTEEDSAGAAAYLHRAGSRTAAHLAKLFDLDDQDIARIDEDVLAEIGKRLRDRRLCHGAVGCQVGCAP